MRKTDVGRNTLGGRQRIVLLLVLILVAWLLNTVLGSLSFVFYGAYYGHWAPFHTDLILNHVNPWQSWDHSLVTVVVPFAFLAAAVLLSFDSISPSDFKKALFSSAFCVFILVVHHLLRLSGTTVVFLIVASLHCIVVMAGLVAVKFLYRRYPGGIFET